MKRTLILSAFFAFSCASVGPLPPPTKGLINCAIQATRDTALNIVPAVSSALATGQWEAQLVSLVAQWGEEAVDCAVHQITNGAMRDYKAAPSDTIAKAKAEHGQAWLAKRAVTFQE